MLKHLSKIITALSFAAVQAQAFPIVQADAFTAGDNKAALEVSSGLVWMDINYDPFNGQWFGDVKARLNTDLRDWRIPTQAEVFHLFASLFSNMPNYGLNSFSGLPAISANANNEDFANIFSIFTNNSLQTSTLDSITYPILTGGGSFETPNGGIGLLFIDYYPVNSPFSGFNYGPMGAASIFQGEEFTEHDGWEAPLLVKKSVPEPSSIILMGIALLGLGVTRRRTAK